MFNASNLEFEAVAERHFYQKSLIFLIPLYMNYQLFLVWIYRFLRDKPILKKTIRDELYQQFCLVHLIGNSIRKSLLIMRGLLGPLPLFVPPIAMLLESFNFGLLCNFFVAMSIFKYLNVFHWSYMNEVDESKVLAIAWTISLSTVIVLTGLESNAHLQTRGSLFVNYYTEMFSGQTVVGQAKDRVHMKFVAVYFFMAGVAILLVLARVGWYNRKYPRAVAEPAAGQVQKSNSLSISSAIFFCCAATAVIFIATILETLNRQVNLSLDLDIELLRAAFLPIMMQIFLTCQDQALRRFVFRRLTFGCYGRNSQIHPSLDVA